MALRPGVGMPSSVSTTPMSLGMGMALLLDPGGGGPSLGAIHSRDGGQRAEAGGPHGADDARV